MFYLSVKEDYTLSDVRMETRKMALQISHQVKEAYARYGYELIMIPATELTLEQMAQYVKMHI